MPHSANTSQQQPGRRLPNPHQTFNTHDLMARQIRPSSKRTLARDGPAVSGPLAGQIAASVGASPALYPYFAKLFSACHGLGTSPQAAANRLKAAGIGPAHSVLDLGCGLGATSLAIARTCFTEVLAVDACGEFIEIAKARATLASLRRASGTAPSPVRCTFVQADFATLQRRSAASPAGTLQPESFDAVILLSILPAIDAIKLARRWVKPGGLYLFDDAVCIDPANAAAGSVPSLDDVSAAITRAGDRILQTDILSPARTAALHRATQARLRTGAASLRRQPLPTKVSLALKDFLAHHRQSLSNLTGSVRPVYWLVERAPLIQSKR